LACAAALAVQQVIRRDGLLDNVKQMGARLRRRLVERFDDHAHVGDIRGRGLFKPSNWSRIVVTSGPSIRNAGCTSASARRPWSAACSSTEWRNRRRPVWRPRAAGSPFIVDAASVDDIVDRLAEAVDAAIATIGEATMT